MESNLIPLSMAMSFLSCGTPTITEPEHSPPFPSSAIKEISYILPSPLPDLSTLTCAVSPFIIPSGSVTPFIERGNELLYNAYFNEII